MFFYITRSVMGSPKGTWGVFRGPGVCNGFRTWVLFSFYFIFFLLIHPASFPPPRRCCGWQLPRCCPCCQLPRCCRGCLVVAAAAYLLPSSSLLLRLPLVAVPGSLLAVAAAACLFPSSSSLPWLAVSSLLPRLPLVAAAASCCRGGLIHTIYKDVQQSRESRKKRARKRM